MTDCVDWNRAEGRDLADARPGGCWKKRLHEVLHSAMVHGEASENEGEKGHYEWTGLGPQNVEVSCRPGLLCPHCSLLARLVGRFHSRQHSIV